MAKTPTFGLQNIRDAVRARASQMSVMAKDCGCSLGLLDSFSRGHLATLPSDVLQAVVTFCWNGHITYNVEADALEPVPQPPASSIGVRPTWKIDIPKIAPGPPQQRGPQPEAPQAKPKQRPGWRGGVWG